jgi:hypothetical protein
VLQLQRVIGNQAVMRLLRSHAIQAKLEIGVVDDPPESEADHVAEQVMRMPEPAPLAVTSPLSVLRRKCSACEEEEKKEEKPVTISRKQLHGGPALSGTAAPASVHEVLQLPGQPLAAATRGFLEPRFGHDFSRVRIHTGRTAMTSAAAMKARAYTVGANIVFGEGQYRPHSREGLGLIAHELTHVVQQGSALVEERVQRDMIYAGAYKTRTKAMLRKIASAKAKT